MSDDASSSIPVEEAPARPATAKDAILDAVRQWIDNPGNAAKISITRSEGLNQNRQPVLVFLIVAEANMLQIVVPKPAPLIQVPSLNPPKPNGTPPR